MHRLASGALAIALFAWSSHAAWASEDFAGTWRLNPSRSEIHSLPAPPEEVLKVEQNGSALTILAADGTRITYPLDGSSGASKIAGSAYNTVTKWEGAALLVNTIVSGPQNYTVMERWRRSRSGDTLTIRRTIVRAGGESESTLIYENTAIEARKEPTLTPSEPASPKPAEADFVVEQGTRVLLRLTNSINTKTAREGDRVYLETAVPVFVNGRLIIPRGSYVAGVVTESREAGRVKGRSALNVRFTSLTLPNGVTRDFNSRPGSVDGRGNLERSEGRIEGEGNKGGDARRTGEATAAGAGIGSVIGAASGHVARGAGIGAAAGAAAGLAGVLRSRGPEVVLPPGTSMELVLDRDLHFVAQELPPRVQ